MDLYIYTYIVTLQYSLFCADSTSHVSFDICRSLFVCIGIFSLMCRSRYISLGGWRVSCDQCTDNF